MAAREEFHRAILELDVATVIRLWKNISPEMPQPESVYDAMVSVHLARVAMGNIPRKARQFSKRWLQDHAERTPVVAAAVGVAVKPLSRYSINRANDVQETLTESVYDSIKVGLDIDEEAPEVRTRMTRAKEKLLRPIVGFRRSRP